MSVSLEGFCPDYTYLEYTKGYSTNWLSKHFNIYVELHVKRINSDIE